MPNIVIPGHGTLLAVTLDPVASPAVFTVIGHMDSNIDIPGFTREVTNITPHNETVARNLVSPVINMDPWNFEMNYVFGDTQHDAVRDFFKANTVVGMKLIGPSGEALDYIACSGQYVSWKLMQPVRTGARKAQVSFQPSEVLDIAGELM